MSLSLFFRSIVAYTAIALIVYGLSPYEGFDLLLKLLAFAAGASLLTPIVYPYLRGVRKGDEVLVESAESRAMPGIIRMLFQMGSGIAIENGRIGGRIMVLLNDGSIRQCVIKNYEGFFKPARVHLVEKEEVNPASITVV